MIKTKIIVHMLLSIIMMLSLDGCVETNNMEIRTVKAIVVEVHYDPVKVVGETMYPADYDVKLQYEDIEVWFDITLSEYAKYKDLVGTSTDVNLVIDCYGDRYLELIKE